ncbi:MAG: alpha/beta hydrolase [Candidatus Dormibacteraeota bacterium]|nr:alpha/beta hydrolase [Candidatus Dormibacteraeota bacterium]
MASKIADLAGPVAYEDFGGSGPAVVLIHGLGGSSLNWLSVGPGIAALGHRTYAPDLLGFGRTQLDGRRSDVDSNQRLLDSFLENVVGGPALLVGNSMGGLISTLQASRRPESVRALMLVDPALPWRGRRRFDFAIWAFFAALLVPGLAERSLSRAARRAGAERVVNETLRMVTADPSRVDPEVIRAHLELAEQRANQPGSVDALAQAARSLLSMLGHPGQYDADYRAVWVPVRFVHGDRDRLVPLEFSLGLAERYGWSVDVLPDIGHVPMLENPAGFLRIVRRWFRSIGEAAG